MIAFQAFGLLFVCLYSPQSLLKSLSILFFQMKSNSSGKVTKGPSEKRLREYLSYVFLVLM